MADSTDIQRRWFLTRVTGATPQASLADLKRTYWFNQSLTGPYEEQERQWLRKIIRDNSGAPVGNSTAELLKQALSALGVTPAAEVTENWLRLFINYNP